MIVSPSTVWNGVDRNISSARPGYGQRPGSGSTPSSVGRLTVISQLQQSWLARESQRAAERSQDHLHQALATAIEGAAADRLGHPMIADRRFKAAISMLVDREAAGKLSEVCAMYADVLRHRGEQDRAFAFMRMAAARDFSKLPALLRAGT